MDQRKKQPWEEINYGHGQIYEAVSICNMLWISDRAPYVMRCLEYWRQHHYHQHAPQALQMDWTPLCCKPLEPMRFTTAACHDTSRQLSKTQLKKFLKKLEVDQFSVSTGVCSCEKENNCFDGKTFERCSLRRLSMSFLNGGLLVSKVCLKFPIGDFYFSIQYVFASLSKRSPFKP